MTAYRTFPGMAAVDVLGMSTDTGGQGRLGSKAPFLWGWVGSRH